MGNFSGIIDGFLMGRNLSEQRKAKRFMGNMLMGNSSDEEQQQFAQLNPQQYMQTQQQLGQQQQARDAQAQAARQAEQKQMIQQMYAAAVSGDEGAMRKLAEVSPPLHKQAMNVMATKGGATDMPSSVRETEWFNKQSKEIQDIHLKIKRGEKTTFDEKLDYDKQKEDIKTDAELDKITKKTQAQRMQGYVDSGVASADNLIVINQSLALLDAVATGGIDKVLLDAKRLFGVESADEAELSYNLGKTVLSQLKPTFGGAFTKDEVKMLINMESNLGKSIEGNKRILRSIQKTSDRATKRALRAAEKLGDEFAADEIRNAIAQATGKSSPFDVVEEQAQAPATPVQAPTQRTPEEQSIVAQLLQAGITQEEINQKMGW